MLDASQRPAVSDYAGGLQEAFSSFNEASTYLAGVYRQLQDQVATLNDELTALRGERARQSAENRRLAQRLRGIFQVLPAAVIVLDGNGVVSECNPAAQTILGRTLQGEEWCAVVSRCFQPQWDDGHDISLRNGKIVTVATQSLTDGAGQIIVITDVTETCRLQQQLARLKRLSAMGEMASALAHQIRTPLSAAVLYASNLMQSGLSSALRDRFQDKLLGRLRDLEGLVEDMLLIARGSHFDTRPVTVAELITGFTSSVDYPDENIAMRVTVAHDAGSKVVTINKGTLVSALQNLVTNAVQAGATSCLLAVTVADADAEIIEITVTDDGSGIDSSLRERVFEPFYTTHANGTGLGLAVVDAVIRAHGGRITLDTGNLEGTRFRIRLPCRSKQKQERH